MDTDCSGLCVQSDEADHVKNSDVSGSRYMRSLVRGVMDGVTVCSVVRAGEIPGLCLYIGHLHQVLETDEFGAQVE